MQASILLILISKLAEIQICFQARKTTLPEANRMHFIQALHGENFQRGEQVTECVRAVCSLIGRKQQNGCHEHIVSSRIGVLRGRMAGGWVKEGVVFS